MTEPRLPGRRPLPARRRAQRLAHLRSELAADHGRRRRWWLSSPPRPARGSILAAAIAAAACVLAVVVLSGGVGGVGDPEREVAAPNTRPTAGPDRREPAGDPDRARGNSGCERRAAADSQELARDLRARFAILRAPERARELEALSLPPNEGRILAAHAREARSADGRRFVVVPAIQGCGPNAPSLCTAPTAPPADDLACETIGANASRPFVMELVQRAGSGRFSVTMLAEDGVDRVTVEATRANGRIERTSEAVESNLASVTVEARDETAIHATAGQ